MVSMIVFFILLASFLPTPEIAVKKPIFFGKHIKLVQYVHDIMPLNILETVPGSGKKFLKNLEVAYQSADEVVASSETTRIKINKIFSKDKAKLLYLPFSPSEKSEVKLNAKAVLQYYKLKRESYLICLSVLEQRKNINRLIQAFTLSTTKPQIKLVLVGDKGEGYKEIINTYNSLNKKMRDRIIITGFINEKEKQVLLDNAKILVHPSIDEGLGIPAIEGIINCKPVLATKLESIQEFAPENGLVYFEDPYDIYEMAEQINHSVQMKYKQSEIKNK